MKVFHLFGTMFTSNKVWDIFHRSRTIKGNHSNDIFKDSWLELLEVAFHTRTFKLEDTGGMGILQELVGGLVV